MQQIFDDTSAAISIFLRRFDLSKYHRGAEPRAVSEEDKEASVAAKEGLSVIVDLQKGDAPLNFVQYSLVSM